MASTIKGHESPQVIIWDGDGDYVATMKLSDLAVAKKIAESLKGTYLEIVPNALVTVDVPKKGDFVTTGSLTYDISPEGNVAHLSTRQGIFTGRSLMITFVDAAGNDMSGVYQIIEGLKTGHIYYARGDMTIVPDENLAGSALQQLHYWRVNNGVGGDAP